MPVSILICLLWVTNQQSFAVGVIYGADDRREASQSTPKPLQTARQSVGAIVPDFKIRLTQDGRYQLRGPTKKARYDLCAEDVLALQPSVADCTGLLVGADLFLTAGHCIPKGDTCERKLNIVFDFHIDPITGRTKSLGSESIYRCAKVLDRGSTTDDNQDYALIRLDREVLGRTAASVQLTHEPQEGDELFSFAHSLGGPLKYIAGAKVRATQRNYFVANLDSFPGSSGSPVFNRQGKLLGIVVRGESPAPPVMGCNPYRQCPDNGCRGEDILLTRQLSQIISRWQSRR